MTGLNSWLSADIMHALGWALIHSLWQCAAVAALAMLAMAFIRRPSVRYLIGVAALAVMLAAPVATFLVLAKPAAPVQVLQPTTASVLPAAPSPTAAYPVAALAGAGRAIIAEAPRPFPMPNILPWLVAAWACGVVLFSLRFAGGFLLLEHRRRIRSHLPGEGVLALCLELQHRLGLDRAIQYLECGWVEAPAVIGWLRPAVLLPVFALTGLTEEQFKAVIAHELAHIRRHDWLVNLFQVLVETLLFYHPAMWWLNRRIRIERELACDEIAVSLTGSRLEYARALAQMAEWKNVSLLAMAANRGPLSQRILHILGRRSSGASQRVAGLTGGVLFLAAALAAANLLFGIAYPVQMAQAKEGARVALVSSQTALEHLARNVVLSAKDAASPSVAPDRMDAAAERQADTLAVPPSDLSRVLPDKNLATPTVVASNDPRPAQPSPNASPAAALDDQPLAPPTTRDLPARPVQAALSAPPATPPNFDPNEPYDKKTCRDVPNGTVTGRVTSSTTIQMPGFACVSSLGGQDRYYRGGSYCFSLGCPCNNHAISDPVFGRVCPPLLTMTVQLANQADASKMPLGKLVTLKGDFFVITQNKIDYLFVQNARVLYADPFDRQAANASVATMRSDQPISLASAAAPEAGSPTRNRTELAMKCWLGLVGYEGCWKSDGCNGGFGPVERVEYLGSTAAGIDVYQVRYMLRIAAYRILLDPKGKTGTQYLVKATDPYWIKREISPHAAPILVYTRPENPPAAAGCLGPTYDGGPLP